MSEGISLREFGRQVGLSGEGVRKAVKEGRIPASCMGEITLRSGRKRPCIVDPEAAAQALGKNTDHTQRRVPNSVIAERRKAAAKGEAPPDESPPSMQAGSKIPTITKSKALKEAYLARLVKIEHDEKLGKLVNAQQIKLEMTNMITAAKSKLLSVPSKARGRLAHLTVSDIELLEEMISEALEELANGS